MPRRLLSYGNKNGGYDVGVFCSVLISDRDAQLLCRSNAVEDGSLKITRCGTGSHWMTCGPGVMWSQPPLLTVAEPRRILH